MSRNSFILSLFFLAGIIFSCSKISVQHYAGEAQWINVITDSSVYFTGKIRADASNNLFCSYNHKEYQINDNTALIKLDTNGNMLWRREFTDFTFYDFVVTAPGNAILASYLNDSMITVSELSVDSGKDSRSWSFSFPFPGPDLKVLDVRTMKIFITADGNYNVSGSLSYRLAGDAGRTNAGYMLEVSSSGNIILPVHIYNFPNPESISAITTITGCAPADPGYLLFGNVQRKDPTISGILTLKTDANGDEIWRTYYETSSYIMNDPDSFYTGYYCSTSDIIPSGDGNFYACAFNVEYNLPKLANVPIYTEDDNSARIYKFNSDGHMLLPQARLKLEFQNTVADLVRTKDNGLLVGLNPFQVGSIFYAGKQSAYVARLNSDLSIQWVSHIQEHYFDYLGSICEMPDGNYAIEMMIQSLGDLSYKLEVIKTDENGNF